MEEMRMKKTILTFVCLLAFILAGCTSAPPAEGRLMNTEVAEAAAPISGLMSLENAMARAVASVEAKTQKGDAVAVVKINAPLRELSDFLLNELETSLSAGAKLDVLARGQTLEIADAEHQFQMSGMVSDESAVGIGHYLGASVVITGDFTRYGSFSQLYIRAIDASQLYVSDVGATTARILTIYSAKIPNGDPALAAMTAPLGPAKIADVNDEALEYLNKGRDLLAAGNHDSAIEEFNRAIAKDRDFVTAYYYRGNTYSDKGEYDRAIADFTQAVRLDPNGAVAYYNRGIAYGKKGEYDNAIADLTQAIRLDPNDTDGYYNRGSVYYMKGEYDRAITDLTQAVRLNPNHAMAYNNRGAMYGDKGDYDRAIVDYTEALRLDPTNVAAYINRGIAYTVSDGDYDRAIADCTQAIRLDPGNAMAYTARGLAYYMQGDLVCTHADLTKALALDPNNTHAQSLLEAIK
jgi:tetratricopeptide (TPR) repeat protein